MATAVLALQGAFIEHEHRLAELGEEVFELRDLPDLSRPFERLVLPGGESTVQAKLLRERQMLQPLKERIEAGMPVLGTCAGAILLARELEGGLNALPAPAPTPVPVYRRRLTTPQCAGPSYMFLCIIPKVQTAIMCTRYA